MAAKWPPDRPLKDRNGKIAFREFEVDGGNTIIGLFQGSFGQHPDLDSIVRYVHHGKNLRTPKHLHWAIDLLLKRQFAPDLTRDFINYLTQVYDGIRPFVSIVDRASRPIQSATGDVLEGFGELNKFGEYSVEFTIYIVEIMSTIEKTSNPNAFMFRQVLERCAEPDLDIFVTISAAGFRG